MFEIDQPEVIEFKTGTLAELGAEPTARRRTVAIDLRDDWPAALEAAGFDRDTPRRGAPRVCSATFRPTRRTGCSTPSPRCRAPGSRFATESTPSPDAGDEDVMRERMQAAADHWREHGFDLNLAELVYFGDRNEAEAYLAAHGWRLTGSTIRELFDAHGMAPFDDEELGGFADVRYVIGHARR